MQSEIKIDLEHCYGIPKLAHTFDFSNNNMPVAIYAPNGVLKTSLAKTFRDYSVGVAPIDQIFPEKLSKCKIVDQNDDPIEPESIFVIDSINEKYQSHRISTLLASAELKAKYDEIYSVIETKKESVFKKLKKSSGLSKDIEEQFADAFKVNNSALLTALGRLEREVKKGENSEFSKLKYKTLFSAKVVEFLNDPDVEKLIQEYTKTYEKIIDNSLYFKKGVFNHSNAEVIAKNLKSNGWFDGGHTVSLNHAETRKEIKTEADLVEAIENEKQKILKDPKLIEMFDKVDSALSTIELKAFREYLIENPFVVPELRDLDAFKQKVWISYLVEVSSEYLDLVNEFDSSEAKIKQIITDAEAEQTRWESVINIFNERFSVPFEVRVENKGDAVLNIAAPQIVFYFKDSENGDDKKTDRALLDKVLSNGEKRALYILNIIFEVEARNSQNIETLFIVDDIADSFDYKNKYAIVEYLNDIKENPNFHLILLTHNFDFYRTIKSRLGIYGENKLLSNRNNARLELLTDSVSENPFNYWKQHLRTPEILIASIPFVRNLAEYTGNAEAFNSLTALLHMKPNTSLITFKDLYDIYSEMLADGAFEVFDSTQDSVLNSIKTVCDAIAEDDNEDLSLEQKISLSIGIRLCAERILINKIDDAEYVASISSGQTAKLLKKYKRLNIADADLLRTMQKVQLMTPENIHLNSFMFEPILDMSGHHLKTLYEEICDCEAVGQ